ncbi:MAG: hypothetical protein K2Y16_14050 [Burkholderiales bacterium]|nr:hypothetical protein [Burkholderiales bacterium]
MTFWLGRLASWLARSAKRQRLLPRPSLKTLLAKVDSKAARNAALARAYLEHGYTLTEISYAAGQSYYTKTVEEMS